MSAASSNPPIGKAHWLRAAFRLVVGYLAAIGGMAALFTADLTVQIARSGWISDGTGTLLTVVHMALYFWFLGTIVFGVPALIALMIAPFAKRVFALSARTCALIAGVLLAEGAHSFALTQAAFAWASALDVVAHLKAIAIGLAGGVIFWRVALRGREVA